MTKKDSTLRSKQLHSEAKANLEDLASPGIIQFHLTYHHQLEPNPAQSSTEAGRQHNAKARVWAFLAKTQEEKVKCPLLAQGQQSGEA